MMLSFKHVPEDILKLADYTYKEFTKLPESSGSIDAKIITLYRNYLGNPELTSEREEKIWSDYMKLKCRMIDLLFDPRNIHDDVQKQVEELLLNIFSNVLDDEGAIELKDGSFHDYCKMNLIAKSCLGEKETIGLQEASTQDSCKMTLDAKNCSLLVKIKLFLPPVGGSTTETEEREIGIALEVETLKLRFFRYANMSNIKAQRNLRWHRELGKVANIVPLKKDILFSQNKISLQLFKYYDLGDAYKIRKQLSRGMGMRILFKTLETLVVLHRMGIVDRDFKLENIVLKRASKKIKKRPEHHFKVGLTDFEYTTTSDDDKAFRQGICGTPICLAPELIHANRKGEVIEPDPKHDMWAFGMACFDLFSSRLPASMNLWIKDATDFMQIDHKMTCGIFYDAKRYEQIKSNCIDDFSKFVCHLLNPNIDERFSSQEALEYLKEKKPVPGTSRRYNNIRSRSLPK